MLNIFEKVVKIPTKYLKTYYNFVIFFRPKIWNATFANSAYKIVWNRAQETIGKKVLKKIQEIPQEAVFLANRAS